MGRSVEEWERERAKPGVARHEHIIPPEDVGGLRTSTGRLLEHEFGDAEGDYGPGVSGYNKLNAVLDALDSYRRTRLTFNNAEPLPDDEFYDGLDAHLDEVASAVKDARKQAKQDAKEQAQAQQEEAREEPVTGGKRTVDSGSSSSQSKS